MSWFAWKQVAEDGNWIYVENTISGAREAFQADPGFYPPDEDWLAHRKDKPRGI